MFISSTAFLPSTFSMYASCAALAAWWHQRYPLAIFFTAISTLLGWPFAALLGLPLCYDVLIIQRKFRLFAFWAGVCGASIIIPMILIDSSYFGKLTIAPLNIVLYNVFTSHGPDLYGIESWTFYLINGILNYNIIWLLALISPLLIIASEYLLPTKISPTLYLPYYLSLAPFYLWLIVFTLQPHKEERFLFPIYPLIGLCGAISIDTIQKIFYRILSSFKHFSSGTHYLDHTTWIAILTLTLSSMFGVSRMISLYYNYHAPMDLMIPLNNQTINDQLKNVCIGKDWYRFPGTFFLPNSNYRLRFLKSEFTGILPAYYAEHVNGTQIVHEYFNDLNQENVTMYTNYDDCHYLVDIETITTTELEPNYVKRIKEWKIINQLPFLDSMRSNSFFRAFYVPIIGESYVQYNQMYLLEQIKKRNT